MNFTYISFYFRSNSVRIFQSAIHGIGDPGYIRFRISEDKRQMLMEPYDKKELTSFKVKRCTDNRAGMQIRGKRFCNMVIKEMGWDPNSSYRVPGKYFEQQNIVLFDLEGAKEISARE